MRAHIPIVTLVLLLTPVVVPGLTPATANAEVITVCWDGSGDYLTIQEGIDAASDGDEVVVCDGSYTGPGNKNLDFAGRAILVRSENGPETCIIDCEGDGGGFYFHSGETAEAVVEGFTITHGSGDAAGGMYNHNSSPTVANCTFSGNAASYGGGMYNYNSSPTVANCTFSENSANFGGGMYNPGGNPTVTNCTFSANSANSCGGGMLNYNSSPTVTNCTFDGNSAGDAGGGMSNWGGNPTVANCTFSNNYAVEVGGGGMDNSLSSATVTNCNFNGNSAGDAGGGMGNWGGNPTVANCAFSGNTAYWWYGGGMYNEDSSSTVINCTFSGNTAAYHGGGICTRDGNLEIANTILWGNTPDEIYVQSGNPAVTYSDIQGGWEGVGNIDADPLFVDPDGPDDDPNTWGDNDYHLSPGSPCIDAGCNGGVPHDAADLDDDDDTDEITPLDLDGEGRFFDDPDTPDSGCGCPPLVDMGAYEFGNTGPQPCPGDLDCNRTVGHSDLGILLAAWHSSADGDLNCDSVSDHADLGILLANWGNICP